MKRMTTGFFAMALALASMPPAQAQDDVTDAAASRVSVTLGDFSDMREVRHLRGTQKRSTTQSIQSLADWLQRQAERSLPQDQSLEVVLRDVDLAGEYEPGRVGMHDIRVVKDIYPPRIELEYRLSDAAGATLRQGEVIVRDSGFLFGAGAADSDPLRFEKRMLRGWLRSLVIETDTGD